MIGEIQYFLRDFFKKTWIIFICFVLAMIISGIASYYLIEPEYKTATTLLIGKSDSQNKEIDYSEILLIQNLSSTYREIAKSRLVADRVINNLKLDISSEALMNRIKVTLVNDTPILKIEVRYKDPKKAALITDEVAKVIMNQTIELMNTNNIKVIDEAKIPIVPTRPKPFLNFIIAGILGIMIGSFIVVFFIYSEDKLESWIDIQKVLGLPMVGTISMYKSRRKSIKSLKSKVVHTDPRSEYAEDYKTLGTYIQFIKDRDYIKNVLIASPRAGEGRSTIAANLAYSLSQTGNKVLLIDGDLRRSDIHAFYRLSNEVGLSNVLMEGTDYVNSIQRVLEGKLDILTAGSPQRNPAELFTKMEMKKLLDFTNKNYDVVLIDSPPAGTVADTGVLSTLADSVLIVCATGESSLEELKSFKEQLNRLNTKILGVVMNKVVFKKNI